MLALSASTNRTHVHNSWTSFCLSFKLLGRVEVMASAPPAICQHGQTRGHSSTYFGTAVLLHNRIGRPLPNFIFNCASSSLLLLLSVGRTKLEDISCHRVLYGREKCSLPSSRQAFNVVPSFHVGKERPHQHIITWTPRTHILSCSPAKKLENLDWKTSPLATRHGLLQQPIGHSRWTPTSYEQRGQSASHTSVVWSIFPFLYIPNIAYDITILYDA